MIQASEVLAQRSLLIKSLAKQNGFEKVGVVRADSLNAERELLIEWLARGYQADMKWLERDPTQRTDPKEFFPEAKSVVVVALNYYTPSQHKDSPETGKVSRYAWGDDYHEVVTSKLRSLLYQIQEEIPEAKGKVCVDIQPTMDKAWAVRAGLGWLGKHSNVITQELGSWVFIGELLLNVDLEYDQEVVEDHCGTCTLCIDACPTEAITEPYVVDSNKCISYLTIESRAEAFPSELAEKLDGWIYGCDICQDVCPWNRFEQSTNEPGFTPRPTNVNVELQSVIDMTHAEYVEKFRHSAMKRAKLSGLQRNARALLNNAVVKA
jgi:epoxyqueuosine reductase